MTQLIAQDTQIQNQILTVREQQVMLDRDLAELYGVETKVLNQAVKRNLERFPESFRFQLNIDEKNELVTNCDRFKSLKHSSALPYVFTEQGVSMLSAVLKSKEAITTSIRIMDTFVSMRRFANQHSLMFQRMEAIERKQLLTDTKVDAILDALEAETQKPEQGIFYDGQIFDAHAFASDLIRQAKSDIVLIDNYIDDTTLTLLSKNQQAKMTLYTQRIDKQLTLDIEKYNKQYQPLEAHTVKNVHDRFLILDNQTCYLIGASLKDLGKKVFAFSKLNIDPQQLIEACKKDGR